MTGEDDLALDPGFADRFERDARPPCQLYLISPERYDPGFPEKLKAALDAGPVAAFQRRLKDVPDMEILRAGAALKPILAAYDVAFILNDRADLAKDLGADGVHLGQTDGSVAAARGLLGHDAQIGVTCHDSRHLAMEAGGAGAARGGGRGGGGARTVWCWALSPPPPPGGGGTAPTRRSCRGGRRSAKSHASPSAASRLRMPDHSWRRAPIFSLFPAPSGRIPKGRQQA